MGWSVALVLFVTLNLIQSRIIEQIARVEIILKPSELVGDTGSNWLIRVVGKLIVFLHITGLVRYRSRIALPKIQPE